jgi:hypothetical protein
VVEESGRGVGEAAPGALPLPSPQIFSIERSGRFVLI